MDSIKIGKFIAVCRKEKGLSQFQLAEVLGVTNKAVSKWETGAGLPDISVIPALAECLGITTDELLAGEKKAVPESVQEQMTQTEDLLQTETKNSTRDQQKIVPGAYPQYNQTQEYLLNRSFVIFKIAACLSAMFSVLGAGVPYFIWLETHDYQGLLFGMWFEIVSTGIFFGAFSVMKNEVRAYNRMSNIHKSSFLTALPFLRVLIQVWLALPVILVVTVLYDAFGMTSGIIRLITILVLYAVGTCFIVRKLNEKRNEEAKATAKSEQEVAE